MLITEYKRLKKEALNKPIVNKKISNSFIENAIVNKTNISIKIIYYLATIIKDFDYSENLNTIIIDANKMFEYTDLKITDIKNNFRKMQQTSITFLDENKNIEENIALIPRIKFDFNRKKIIEIDIYSKIAKLIHDVKEKYSFLKINELMKLKNKHSIRLLPILEMINQFEKPAIKQKTYTLEDLNVIFNTNYKRYPEIERKVLKKIQEELDNGFRLTFEYEMKFESLGKGRPSITGVIIKPKFLNQKKDINIKSNSTIIDDNKINQIKK